MNCKHHVSDIAIKLNRENALPFNLNFVNLNTSKTIYYAIFDSHINYANVIWVQNFSAVYSVYLWEKALRTISFQSRDCHLSPLCKIQNYLNLKIKFNLKMYSYSVNTSIIYYQQFLTNGSPHFAPKYIIITQLPPLHYR